MQLSIDLREKILLFQPNEVTEHFMYHKLSRAVKSPESREILTQIGDDELEHHKTWRTYTGQDVEPYRLKIWLFTLISRILGLTFGIKLMERGEEDAQDHYQLLAESIEDADRLVQE